MHQSTAKRATIVAGLLSIGWPAYGQMVEVTGGPSLSICDGYRQSVVFEEALLFTADDGVSGCELWRFDGTDFRQVADANPGPGGSFPVSFIAGDDRVYLALRPSNEGSREIWQFDRTGLQQVIDLDEDGLESNVTPLLATTGGVFVSRYVKGQNTESLWYVTEGEANEIHDSLVRVGGFPAGIVEYEGELIFAGHFAGAGSEVLGYDGREVRLIGDLEPGPLGSLPSRFFVTNDGVLVNTQGFSVQNDLWRVTADEAVHVERFGIDTSIADMTLLNGNVYFRTRDRANQLGWELWVTDGFDVDLVEDINPGRASSNPMSGASLEEFVIFRDALLFYATDGSGSRELWQYDGSERTAADLRVDPTVAETPLLMGSGNGDVFYWAEDVTGTMRLWQDNGELRRSILTASEVPDSPFTGEPDLNGLKAIHRHGTVYQGDLYLTWNGGLWRIPAWHGVPECDVDGNRICDVGDIDYLSQAIRNGWASDVLDLNGDGIIDGLDRQVWVHDLAGTYFGDANLDDEFNSTDLVLVFESGGYEDTLALNSTWTEGDWDGDGDFTTSDLVLAFQDGGFEQGPRIAANVVPEPKSLAALLAGLIVLANVSNTRRKRV